MASLNMQGPYVLVPDKIDEVVPAKTPGNYAIGYVADSDFIVRYVGRASTDLNRELKGMVYRLSDCLFFKFSMAKSSKEAFKKECINYHDFGGNTQLKNTGHPVRRNGEEDWKCPCCDV
ncbi:MAG: hypothetical protein KJ893_09375 [Candidatus Omnitrophica bacterium]|nr:hypothetical protein [Candidatus Omnitrophota bacterium]MBU4479192.1 hypothetical protein [Candidatus Omnitrophota bacterium]MCG2704196.1 hypothetical protein [Candidatus Omnitrophota bacterium]